MQLRSEAEPKEAPTAQTVVAICPSCGDGLPGQFCSLCGEKRPDARDYSLRNFFGEALNVFTNVESSLFRSYAALLRRPGLLTVDFFAGRRKRYLKPLQLFLFCNIIFFFAQSYTGFKALSTPLYVHLHQMPYSTYARRLADQAVREKNITPREYRDRFDATIENHAKTLVILMVPMFALLLLVLYWRSGRYFAEHLVFSAHFYSFYLLVLSAVILVSTAVFHIARAIGPPGTNFQSDMVVTGVLLLSCGVYLFSALRRVYAQGSVSSALKCLLLLVGLLFVLQSYRFALFFTTYYSI